MARYDTTELIAGIRAKARIPDESADYTDARILIEADEVLLNRIVQEILGTFQEHYVTFVDHSIVMNEPAINVPGINVGSVLRDVVYFTGSTNVSGFSLARVALEELDTVYGSTNLGQPIGHVFRDDQIILVPPPNASSGICRIHIEYRPGKLIVPADAMQIVDINEVSGQLSSATTLPTVWDVQDTYDIIRSTSPFAIVGFGLTPTSLGATDIAFDGLDFNRVAVGGYVALAGESPVAQCHAAFFTALQWGTTAVILQSTGDHEGGSMAQKRFENGIVEARHLITPRNKGEAEYIINRNGHIRNRRGGFGRGAGFSS